MGRASQLFICRGDEEKKCVDDLGNKVLYLRVIGPAWLKGHNISLRTRFGIVASSLTQELGLKYSMMNILSPFRLAFNLSSKSDSESIRLRNLKFWEATQQEINPGFVGRLLTCFLPASYVFFVPHDPRIPHMWYLLPICPVDCHEILEFLQEDPPQDGVYKGQISASSWTRTDVSVGRNH